MYKFWYDFVKLYYSENSKLFYMDKDSFIVYLKTDDIAEDVETRFDTFDKFRNRQTLTYWENKKVIGLVKDETCSYLKDNHDEDKKAKDKKH